MLVIERNPAHFSDWPALLQLLNDSFAFMQDRIDPPSSMTRLDHDALMEKAKQEDLVLAIDRESSPGDQLKGCLFARHQPRWLYVGKIAVANDVRRQGVARRLIDEAAQIAGESNLEGLELQVRIELTENHNAFTRMGFVKVGESAHPGYDRPTSVTLRKSIR